MSWSWSGDWCCIGYPRFWFIGVERGSGRRTNAEPEGHRAPGLVNPGGPVPLQSLSRATRHECACVPETHGLRRDLLPGRGKREEVFPRRKGTCRSGRGAPVGRDLPSARIRLRQGYGGCRRVGLRLSKEPRVSTACGRCDRGIGEGRTQVKMGAPAWPLGRNTSFHDPGGLQGATLRPSVCARARH